MGRQVGSLLTHDEIALIKEFLHTIRNTPVNARLGQEVAIPPFAPEVYLAKLPNGGIAARSVSGSDLIVHGEDCDIYKISLADGKLTAITNVKRKVWNPYPVKWYGTAAHAIYIRVQRDKFGVWVAEKPPYRYKCKAKADITAGSHAATGLYINGAEVEEVDAYNNWMNGGVKISNGNEGKIEYQEDEAKWCWTEAECE